MPSVQAYVTTLVSLCAVVFLANSYLDAVAISLMFVFWVVLLEDTCEWFSDTVVRVVPPATLKFISRVSSFALYLFAALLGLLVLFRIQLPQFALV